MNCYSEDCDGFIHATCCKLLLDKHDVPQDDRPADPDVVFCAKGCYNKWKAEKKSVPGEIDDWPMAFYGADNNAVSGDEMVGPPKHIQWRSGPSWTRSRLSRRNSQN